jgi:hypothetical protein
MSEVNERQLVWFPDEALYSPREGVYAQPLNEFTLPEMIDLVQQRIKEDGEWLIENGRVGNNEELMRKRMEWASKPDNITQCFLANVEADLTMDWLCRELATAAMRLGTPRA